MKRETIIQRSTDTASNFSLIHYGIEEWFENYYKNPVKENEYEASSEVVQRLLSFVSDECDEQPLLVINNIGRREYFFDEYRKAFDPYCLSETLKSSFEFVLETEEDNYGAELIYRTIYEQIKPKNSKLRDIIAEHQFHHRSHSKKYPGSRRYYPTQLDIKIYDMDEWSKLISKNILYVTSGDAPCLELFKMLGAKKIICVNSFIGIQNPD